MPRLGEVFKCGGKELKVLDVISEGNFSNVYKIAEQSNEELLYAMKVEKRQSNQQ